MGSSRQPHRSNYNIPGQAHELTWTCYHRCPFLSKEQTCEWLADALNAARSQLNFSVWAYVFMPEHVHLIIYPNNRTYEIETIRQTIKEPCARTAVAWLKDNAPEWLPRITRQKGKRIRRYFWQTGGGYDRNIEQGSTLLEMIDYVHENPCRKGFVQRASDWKWS
ncbi:MAG: transposase, partial [Planctomycetaceae bacterium]|nr:transposase [Planctomycetaceae bacterium]